MPTALTLTAPGTPHGYKNAFSGAFTIATDSGNLAANTLITFSDGGAGGVFVTSAGVPVTSFTMASGTSSATFKYIPTATGAKTISITNDQSLTNPSPVTYTGDAWPAGQIVWNPLVQQTAESDTLYGPMDAAVETGLIAGAGGFNPVGSHNPSDPPVAPTGTAAGRFNLGHQPSSTTFDFWSMPIEGLIPPSEWAIECWVKSADWSTANGRLFAIGSLFGSFYVGVSVGGALFLECHNRQKSPADSGFDGAGSLDPPTWAANQWISIALTYKSGTLTLYVNGISVKTKAITIPKVIGCQALADGLSLLNDTATPISTVVISDLRISRYVRPIGTPFTIPTPTVAIGSATGGTWDKTLLGGVQEDPSAVATANCPGNVLSLRCDKFLMVTPIKAGAPDGTRPTAGHSGSYAYDWQVVDRTLDRAVAMMGASGKIYVSLDACPQILGGGTPPYSGSQLTTDTSKSAGFDTTVPNDFAAYATLCSDLIYHIVTEKGYPVDHFGVWNEPDGTSWSGTQTQYFQLYAAIAAAVKALSSSYKIGGPETSAGAADNTCRDWIQKLIDYCQTNTVPLDFISWHHYNGDLGEMDYTQAIINAECVSTGFGVSLPMLIGEYDWQTNNMPGTGTYPWQSYNYFNNDWHGAWTAAQVIQAQRLGVIADCLYATVAPGGTGFDTTGLIASGHVTPNLNIYKLFAKMGSEIRALTDPDWPGVAIFATRNTTTGHYWLLLSYLRYRKDLNAVLTITAPGIANFANHWLMDDAHSDYYDGGAGHEALETGTPLSAVSGSFTLTLRPRSVHLLEMFTAFPVNRSQLAQSLSMGLF